MFYRVDFLKEPRREDDGQPTGRWAGSVSARDPGFCEEHP